MHAEQSTLEVLNGFIAHAPRDPGAMAPGLTGWRIKGERSGWPEDVTICAHCAGRIMARGCTLKGATKWGTEPEPIWDTPVKCALCWHFKNY